MLRLVSHKLKHSILAHLPILRGEDYRAFSKASTTYWLWEYKRHCTFRDSRISFARFCAILALFEINHKEFRYAQCKIENINLCLNNRSLTQVPALANKVDIIITKLLRARPLGRLGEYSSGNVHNPVAVHITEFEFYLKEAKKIAVELKMENLK